MRDRVRRTLDGGYAPFRKAHGGWREESPGGRTFRGSVDLGAWAVSTTVVRLQVSPDAIVIGGWITFGTWMARRADVEMIVLREDRPTEVRFRCAGGESLLRFWLWWSDRSELQESLESVGWQTTVEE